MTEKVTGKVVLRDLATLAKDLGVYLADVGKTLYLKLKTALKNKDDAEKEKDKDDGKKKKRPDKDDTPNIKDVTEKPKEKHM